MRTSLSQAKASRRKCSRFFRPFEVRVLKSVHNAIVPIRRRRLEVVAHGRIKHSLAFEFEERHDVPPSADCP